MPNIRKQARKALEGALEHWVPDDPNAVRVRYSGGTRNDAWEREGASRSEREIALAFGAETAEKDEEGPTDREDKGIQEATILEDVLEVGDRVELLDDPDTAFEVQSVNDVRGDRVFAWTVTLQEVESRGPG